MASSRGLSPQMIKERLLSRIMPVVGWLLELILGSEEMRSGSGGHLMEIWVFECQVLNLILTF